MTVAEKFDHLMNIIQYWTEDVSGTDRYVGPFRHLSKDLWIREVCVTPGCGVSVAQLKTFLASVVLEIYPWNNRSKISYRDIQKFLEGGDNCKKYSFFFGELEKCFSAEENADALERSQLCRKSCPLMGNIEEERTVPLYLLEKLQTMVRIKMGEYWHMCNPDPEQTGLKKSEQIKWKQKIVAQQEEDVDEASAPKQNKYMECLMTVALHEIFVRECERQLLALQEEINQSRSCVESTKDKIDVLVKSLLNAEEENAKAWLEDTADSVRKVEEYTRRVSKNIFLLGEYTEHVIGVETEIMLIMILETKNLEVIKRDASLGRQMTKYLECMRDRSTESFLRYNKNRGTYYKQLETDIRKIFISYMEHINTATRQSFSEAMHTYLMILENGKTDEEKRKNLWEAQCVLAMPLWHASGEDKEQI